MYKIVIVYSLKRVRLGKCRKKYQSYQNRLHQQRMSLHQPTEGEGDQRTLDTGSTVQLSEPNSKQDKILEKRKTYQSEPWIKPSLNDMQKRDLDKMSAHMSEPWIKPTLNNKPDLKEMHTLTECVELIHKLAEQVKDITKPGKRRLASEGGTVESPSLATSRSLLLHWAGELEQVGMLQKQNTQTEIQKMRTQTYPLGGDEEKTLESDEERLQKWAIELRNVKAANGLSDEDLKKLLCTQGVKESGLRGILPLLEFVAWSLISNDTEDGVSKLWLSTKQRKWTAGNPKYIPNSVWLWIHSASVPVHLDPHTSHPWLSVSDDRLQVQKAIQRCEATKDPGHFDGWPCVLGDRVITTGRHYWEVKVSAEGTWRLGVTLISAPRKERFHMSPECGYWTLWRGFQNLWACTDSKNPAKLAGVALPCLVGVYLDVEEGQVSFYDVENRTHIYTFSDTFSESLAPVFSCLDGDIVMKIVPPTTA